MSIETVNPFPATPRLGGLYDTGMAIIVGLASGLPLLTLYPGASLSHFLIAALLCFTGLGLTMVYFIRAIIQTVDDYSELIRVHRAIKNGS